MIFYYQVQHVIAWNGMLHLQLVLNICFKFLNGILNTAGVIFVDK